MDAHKRTGILIEILSQTQDMYYIKDLSADISKVPFPVHNIKFIFTNTFEVPNKNQSIHTRVEGRVQTVSKRKGMRKQANSGFI